MHLRLPSSGYRRGGLPGLLPGEVEGHGGKQVATRRPKGERRWRPFPVTVAITVTGADTAGASESRWQQQQPGGGGICEWRWRAEAR